MLIQSLLESLGLHDVRMNFRTVGDRSHPLGNTLLIDVNDQLHAGLFCHLVPEIDHFTELPRGVYMHQWKWWYCWSKCFAGQVKHYCRIFPDGIQHDWLIKLSNHLTNNVDAFRFEGFEVGEALVHDNLRANIV